MLAPNVKNKVKLFHATMQVTRLEEWCVEAETADEARELLTSGAGHRCNLGDCLNVELDQMLDEA
jgi:hypothetical protein